MLIQNMFFIGSINVFCFSLNLPETATSLNDFELFLLLEGYKVVKTVVMKDDLTALSIHHALSSLI